MSDQGATLTPSPAPPAPTGPRPKVTNRGRTTIPAASSNSDSTDVPEFEPFGVPGPRGYPPMTGERLYRKCALWSLILRKNMFIYSIQVSHTAKHLNFSWSSLIACKVAHVNILAHVSNF